MSFAEPDLLGWLGLIPIGFLLVLMANQARRRALARLGEAGLMA